MKPCDCKTTTDIKSLREQGLKYNDESIKADSTGIVLEIYPHFKARFSHRIFKRFAEWYLEDQRED